METTETKKKETGLSLLKPFDVAKAELIQMAEDYGKLVVTPETFEDAKKAREKIREKRFAIQNIVKDNKAILNKLKTTQEEQGEELINLILPTEERIDAGIKAIENKKAEEKARKEREEQERIQGRINLLFSLGMKFDGSAYVFEELRIDSLQIKHFNEKEFTDFTGKLKIEFEKAQKKKVEEERLKKEEEERLAKIREEQEAESNRLAAIKKEQDEKEAQLKAEQERIANEKKAEEEKIKRQREEMQAKQRTLRSKELHGLGLAFTGENFKFYDIVINNSEIDSLSDEQWDKLIIDITPKIEAL
jgi:colicin import membrane protein